MNNNTLPLVTIIIPVKNRKNLLIRALNSLLLQTYSNYCIFVIDDNSSQDIQSVILEYKNDKIKYFKLDNGFGGGAARAYGVLKSEGELVCFLDSDDEWHKLKLEIQVNHWKKEGKQEKYFSYTDVIQKFPNNSYLYHYLDKDTTENRELPELIFSGDFHIQTSSYLFSSDLIKSINFRPIPKHQDWDILFRLDEHDIKFNRIDLPLTIWHQGDGKNTSSIDRANYSIEWYNNTVLSKYDNIYYEKLFYEHIIFPQNHFNFIRKFKLIMTSRLKFKLYFKYLFLIIKKILHLI